MPPRHADPRPYTRRDDWCFDCVGPLVGDLKNQCGKTCIIALSTTVAIVVPLFIIALIICCRRRGRRRAKSPLTTLPITERTVFGTTHLHQYPSPQPEVIDPPPVWSRRKGDQKREDSYAFDRSSAFGKAAIPMRLGDDVEAATGSLVDGPGGAGTDGGKKRWRIW